MSLGSISPDWSVKAREGSSCKLSHLNICFLSGMTKFGIHGTLSYEAASFSFLFSFSPLDSLSLSPRPSEGHHQFLMLLSREI